MRKKASRTRYFDCVFFSGIFKRRHMSRNQQTSLTWCSVVSFSVSNVANPCLAVVGKTTSRDLFVSLSDVNPSPPPSPSSTHTPPPPPPAGAGLLQVVLRLLVLVFICLHLRLPFKVRFGVLRRSMAMLAWSVAVLLCLFLGYCRLCSGQNFWAPFLLHKRTGLPIRVLITSMLPGLLVGCWVVSASQSLCLWLKMGIWLLLLST